MKSFFKQQNTPSKAKTLTTIIVLSSVFVALMLVGTFWDLDIAKWISKNSLSEGEYYCHNQFALEMEALGSFPIWLAVCFAACVAFWLTAKSKYAYFVRVLMSFGCGVVGVVSAFKIFDDAFGYVAEQKGIEQILTGDSYFGVALGLGFIVWILCVFAAKNLSADKKKLWGFVLVVVCTAALYGVVALLKSVCGRVRFRTMNYLGDMDLFSAWYKTSSMDIEGLPSDSCRSFPSGHTFSAGLIYVLLCLPYIFEKLNTKFVSVALWTVCVAYVGAVAISRMMAGAHFLSDVVFGGSLSLIGVLAFREIFLAKGQNLAVFKKQKTAKNTDDCILA